MKKTLKLTPLLTTRPSAPFQKPNAHITHSLLVFFGTVSPDQAPGVDWLVALAPGVITASKQADATLPVCYQRSHLNCSRRAKRLSQLTCNTVNLNSSIPRRLVWCGLYFRYQRVHGQYCVVGRRRQCHVGG